MDQLTIHNHEVRTKIGLIYFEQGRLEEAIAQFSMVLSAQPENDRVRYYLATAYEESKDLERAVVEFQRVRLLRILRRLAGPPGLCLRKAEQNPRSDPGFAKGD